MKRHPSHLLATACLSFTLLSPSVEAAGAFLFAGEANRARITHMKGYTGANQQHLVVRVGILPGSANSNAMVIPTQNAIRTWNGLQGTLPNLFYGADAGFPSNRFDWESVLLHEMGHALGMAHPGLSTESGLALEFHDYTKSTLGANGVYNLNAGADGVPGSRLDIRGDDLPLVWFHKATNDPFQSAPIVDATTFSQNLPDLPAGHSYVANGSNAVAVLLGYGDSEVILQQGTRNGEAQRQLTPGCVALVRLALSGVDRIEGTADDYTFELQYVGITSNADITVGFNNNETGFAVCRVSATSINSSTYVLTNSQIYFNTGYNWHFNQVPNEVIPPPQSSIWSIY